MNDSTGIEPHQSSAGCVGGHRIIRDHNASQRTRGAAVQGPVSFHRHDTVRDNKVDWDGSAQIEDALLNTLPVENILRPAGVLITTRSSIGSSHAGRDGSTCFATNTFSTSRKLLSSKPLSLAMQLMSSPNPGAWTVFFPCTPRSPRTTFGETATM